MEYLEGIQNLVHHPNDLFFITSTRPPPLPKKTKSYISIKNLQNNRQNIVDANGKMCCQIGICLKSGNFVTFTWRTTVSPAFITSCPKIMIIYY